MADVPASELGVNMEEQISKKSLLGNELPSDWPKITPDVEYQNRFEGFTPGVDHPIEKFSTTLEQGPKKLIYLAVEHTNNPENPQFDALEQNFKEVSPQIVLHEGPPNAAAIQDRETSIKYGETAFLHFLVQEHNANLQAGEEQIAIESTDMPDNEWVQEFQNSGHTNEEIGTYDVLRKVNVVAEQIRRNTKLSDEERTSALEELGKKINSDFIVYISEKGFPNLFTQLPRQDGKAWNTETIQEEVKRQTEQDLNADLSQQKIPKFKQMFDEETEFRDKYVLKKIVDKVKQKDKVMAVMGSSHVLREESALREFFDSK